MVRTLDSGIILNLDKSIGYDYYYYYYFFEEDYFLFLIILNLYNCRLVVVLQEKTYIYDSNSLEILDTVDTVPNLKGKVECVCCVHKVAFAIFQVGHI